MRMNARKSTLVQTLATKLAPMLKTVLYRSGAFHLYHTCRNRDSLTVVMFHRILPETDPRFSTAIPAWTITPSRLAECLSFFKRHYNVVSSLQIAEFADGKSRLPPRALLVTFDDGWADTAEYAQPVLDRFNVKAHVFVTASPDESPAAFWEDRLHALLLDDRKHAHWLKDQAEELGIQLELPGDEVPLPAVAARVIAQLEKIPSADIQSLVARLDLRSCPCHQCSVPNRLLH